MKWPELLPVSPSHRQIHHGFIKPSNFQNPNKFLSLSLMARKQRSSLLDDPPAVSSSTEEEEQEEEETFSDDEEEEEEEEEGEQEEDKEEGEQSSSEEDEEQAEAAKIESLPVKPHSSSSGSETKPMEPESTPVKATQVRSTRSSTVKKKRPNSETETTPSKRVKKKDPDPEPKSQVGGGGEEKKLFQRVWSDDNEIELLKGMLDYRALRDSDPAADAAAFYEFVKKSLHVEVTKAQLVDKMKRLRKKYRNNAGRGKKGKDPTFSKPHERKTYELSNKIWGCAAADGVSGRCLNEMLSFNKNVVLEESLIKKGLELIGQQKRLELEERWKRVELAALQMYVTWTELLRDQANLILEAYKGH